MSSKWKESYDEQERKRQQGTLKVIDASELPKPRDKSSRRFIPTTTTTTTTKSGGSQQQVKIIHRPLPGWGQALGLTEDPVETIVVPLTPKRKLADVIGTGSYPKPIRGKLGSEQGGVTLEQRRRKFLKSGHGVDKSQSFDQN